MDITATLDISFNAKHHLTMVQIIATFNMNLFSPTRIDCMRLQCSSIKFTL